MSTSITSSVCRNEPLIVVPHCLNFDLFLSGMALTLTKTHMLAGQALGHQPAVDASQVRGDSFNTDYGSHCHRMVRGLKGKNSRVSRAVTRDYH